MIKNYYAVLLLVLIIILSCQKNKVSSSKESRNLIIIHMNDTHGKDEEENGKYGAARRAAYIKQVKATNDNVLILHAGDTITGSILSAVLKGNDEVRIMNKLKVGAAAVGNHFIDYGLDNFNQIIKDRNFPTLSVNIKNKSDNSYYAKPYMVTNINRIKVAVVGVTVKNAGYNTQYSQNLVFEDEIQSLKKFMSEIPLHTTNDVTILLSHAGYNIDIEIANAITNTFDVIIGGHTHTLLQNANIVNGTPIVQAGYYGQYLGNINLYTDNRNTLKFNYKLVPMDQKIKQDPDMLDLVNKIKTEAEKLSSEKIGALSEDLNYNVTTIRAKSTPLGNLVCDLILDSNQDTDKAEMVFINAGGIRAGLTKGNITLANIISVSPYDNEVILVTLTGKDILDLLKIACKKSAVIQGNSGGGFFQTSRGMEVLYNSSGDLISAKLNGSAISESRSYRVALSTYIYNGGDYVDASGKPIAQKGQNINMTGKDCRDDMISKIKSLGNINSSYIDNTVRINVQ